MKNNKAIELEIKFLKMLLKFKSCVLIQLVKMKLHLSGHVKRVGRTGT